MDPTQGNSVASQSLPGDKIYSPLYRSKSLGCETYSARGSKDAPTSASQDIQRTLLPAVLANIKRVRSAASTQSENPDVSQLRLPSPAYSPPSPIGSPRIQCDTSDIPSRESSVPRPDSFNGTPNSLRRGVRLPNKARKHNHARERSVSNHDLSDPRDYHREYEQCGKSRPVEYDVDRKLKPLPGIPHVSTTLIQEPVTLWEDEDPDEGTDEPHYIAKGAFLLKNGRPKSRFSSPRVVDQSKPTWLLGDGFSGDEGKPGYGLFGIIKRKRRSRSRPPAGSRVGQLETEPTTQKRRKASRLDFNRHFGSKTKRRRGPPKDIWPTATNFAEDIFVRETSTKPDSSMVVPETQKNKGLTHHSSSNNGGGGDVSSIAKRQISFQYIPPQDKGSVDFENFRRVRGLQLGDARFLLSQTTYHHGRREFDKDSHVVLDSDDEDDEVSVEISTDAFEIESMSQRSISLGERSHVPVDDNNEESRSASTPSSRSCRVASRLSSLEVHVG